MVLLTRRPRELISRGLRGHLGRLSGALGRRRGSDERAATEDVALEPAGVGEATRPPNVGSTCFELTNIQEHEFCEVNMHMGRGGVG